MLHPLQGVPPVLDNVHVCPGQGSLRRQPMSNVKLCAKSPSDILVIQHQRTETKPDIS